ncbi:hypothetical protein G6F46_009120 [Rhizopus delemar]|uniref:Uncharacterized protein n=2 Tax=Rhizopus TaxID=4842 RepID=A0A9P6YXL1_9FUNG|nr:hypothetical protein G6F43_007403 [Rhizopus delemar]KAG1241751.1 hypothetical protein G6F65_023367 [Rhizopus arrhizus]KAG1461142.1 hypothetical protein G6F55_003742 [Rhizopus delemar]KAG1498637.1 hypothetical protein G6F54_004942 [Rhizopus delemar]KAG1511598.1 hypothetical protein G6F53_005827 [Rhizopus delemar]
MMTLSTKKRGNSALNRTLEATGGTNDMLNKRDRMRHMPSYLDESRHGKCFKGCLGPEEHHCHMEGSPISSASNKIQFHRRYE